MSTPDAAAGPLRSRLPADGRWVTRGLTVVAVLALTASYLVVLADAVTIGGTPVALGGVTLEPVQLFTAVVAVSLLAGVLVERYVPLPVALGGTALIGLLGGGLYLWRNPTILAFENAPLVIAVDIVALLTGLSILRIIDVATWSIAFAPLPVFLSWYLVASRRYVSATLVGGGALAFLVLTGDAELVTTLLGVLAGAAVIGFGDIDRLGGGLDNVDAVAVVLAVMVLLTVSVGLVPGGAADPILRPGGIGGGTLETSLTSTEGEIQILGPISLSPEVRFSVQADEQQYWHVSSYNRFTGRSWVRTGTTQGGSLSAPPGPSRTVSQRFVAESAGNTLPAAWRPVDVQGVDYEVTSFGDLQPATPLAEGDSYEVTSRVSNARPAELRQAGTDYPAFIEEQYLETGGLSDRFVSDVTTLTSNAENPYDTARVIEVWLQENREYSLDVRRPDGNIAEAFFYEMEAGYCTYYASTMVMMLRSQGVPARFVVGYTPGEQVGSNEWVVRGLDSHAWVEAYFPGHGWVRFDPTPAGPRQAAESSSLDSAREQGAGGTDTSDTARQVTTQTPTITPTNATNASSDPGVLNPQQGQTPDLGDIDGGSGAQGDPDAGGFQLTLPTREQALLGVIVLFGAVAAARRTGVTGRAYRALWLRRQSPSGEAERDVQRAFDRLEYLLSRERRPRRTGETPRQYLGSMGDQRIRRVGTLYERVMYAGETDPELVRETIDLVDAVVSDHRRF